MFVVVEQRLKCKRHALMIYISVKLGLAPALTTRISMRVVRAEDYFHKRVNEKEFHSI
jgi:hypothetical protein